VCDGNSYSYGLASKPNPTVEADFVPWYRLYGTWRTDFTLSADSAPGKISVRACHVSETDKCSDEAPITATTAPTVVNVSFGECLPLIDKKSVVKVSGAASGSYGFSAKRVPDTVSEYDVTITWNGAFSTLSPITHRMYSCL
jgi:hypothetical protein